MWGGDRKGGIPTQTKRSNDSYIKRKKNLNIERVGGPVRAHGGRVSPGMKTGGLRYINGKWVRI